MCALADLYQGWAETMQARPDMPLAEIRDLFEHWGDVTGEPGGVDYIEDDAGGIACMWAHPKGGARDRVLLCMHGGGYALGSMYSHRKLYGHFAKAFGVSALIVNYRRAPEHLHPGPLDDVVSVYHWLLSHGKIAPEHIIFLGDSAGGALAISTMLRARERALPLPAAGISLAPYLDVEATGASYEINADKDKLGSREATLAFVGIFLGPDGNRKDPLANPLLADMKGLPPMLLQVGGDDVLLDDSKAFFAKAQASGIDVSLEIEPNMQHVYHFLAGASPEADAAVRRAAAWGRPKISLIR
jgi:epsilon-lactone hydrolase